LKDFEDLDQIDGNIQEAIMNFSFYLSTGNLDEAYKSVKSVSNPAVWEKMAAMSVKSKRLDVAEICLGNMRFARGARAVRESKKETELESQLAMVAIQLNMKEEAIKLYE
jgi:intraflagellar transport protein 140